MSEQINGNRSALRGLTRDEFARVIAADKDRDPLNLDTNQQAMQRLQDENVKLKEDINVLKCTLPSAIEVRQLKEAVRVGDQISGSFFEALKRLNLTHLRVEDPGSHVVDLIDERDRLQQEVDQLKAEKETNYE